MGTTLGEVRAEAVPTNVFHFVLVRERRNSTGGILFAKGFVEKDKVGEAAADGKGGLLEGLEVCLNRAKKGQRSVANGILGPL